MTTIGLRVLGMVPTYTASNVSKALPSREADTRDSWVTTIVYHTLRPAAQAAAKGSPQSADAP